MKVAHGIFMWDGRERHNDRYGCVYPTKCNFNGDASAELSADGDALKDLDGKWVKVTCTVVENRKSGHARDFAIGVFPSCPEVGESVVVGVGRLKVTENGDGDTAFEIDPEDGREVFWLNPERLYRLHDQTVDFDIETTDEGPEPMFKATPSEEGVWSNGDGSVQVKTKAGRVNVRPTFDVIDQQEDGCTMVMVPPGSQPCGTKIG